MTVEHCPRTGQLNKRLRPGLTPVIKRRRKFPSTVHLEMSSVPSFQVLSPSCFETNGDETEPRWESSLRIFLSVSSDTLGFADEFSSLHALIQALGQVFISVSCDWYSVWKETQVYKNSGKASHFSKLRGGFVVALSL